MDKEDPIIGAIGCLVVVAVWLLYALVFGFVGWVIIQLLHYFGVI